MSLLWFCVAWLIGIVLGDWLALPADLAGFGAGCVALLGCIWWPRRDIRLPFLLAAACLLGAARLAYAQPVTTAASVWAYTGHKVIVSGVVA